jgi:hypothetical protein
VSKAGVLEFRLVKVPFLVLLPNLDLGGIKRGNRREKNDEDESWPMNWHARFLEDAASPASSS